MYIYVYIYISLYIYIYISIRCIYIYISWYIYIYTGYCIPFLKYVLIKFGRTHLKKNLPSPKSVSGRFAPDQAWTSSIPLQHWRRRLNLSPAVDTKLGRYWGWLVVLTILKNISQWEGLSHILWKIKNGPNHQPGGEGMTKYQDSDPARGWGPVKLRKMYNNYKFDMELLCKLYVMWNGPVVEDGFSGSLDWMLGCPHIFVATCGNHFPTVTWSSLQTLTVRLTYLGFAKNMVTLNPMDSINQY